MIVGFGQVSSDLFSRSCFMRGHGCCNFGRSEVAAPMTPHETPNLL